MRWQFFKAVVAVGFAVVIGGVPARAGIIAYDTQAAYLAAISEPGVDTYDDLTVDGSEIPGPLNRTAGIYVYAAETTGANSFYAAGSAGDPWLANYSVGQTIALTGFATNVRGVGGFFFATDLQGNFLPGQTLTMTVADGTDVLTQVLNNPTPSSFLGFVFDSPITLFTITAVQPANNISFATINDLTVGRAVPEPASLMGAGLGVLGAVVVARRRRSRV